jgi:hypothetical protein
VVKVGIFGKKDAAKETGTSTSKTSKAWHQARDDSDVRSGGDSKNFESAPDWADSKLPSGQELFPPGKS